MQIPATDTFGSAAFYEKIFGWRIERPYASFEAPGLIGQWIEGRPALDAAGILMWINVDHIDETLELVRAAGGEVLEPPSVDGPRWLARIRDPGQNVIGVVQHGPRSWQTPFAARVGAAKRADMSGLSGPQPIDDLLPAPTFAFFVPADLARSRARRGDRLRQMRGRARWPRDRQHDVAARVIANTTSPLA